MIRQFAMPAAALAALACSTVGTVTAAPVASAEPVNAPVYAIGMCYDTDNPLPQRPETFDYNCDETGVLQNMTWTSWGAEGANGTGTDNSIECQPNCAQGTRLLNPVVVHAWNPKPASGPLCPAGTQFYSDMTIAYPQGVPPWIAPGAEWSPGTDFVTVDGMPAVHFSGLTSTCEDQLR